MISTGHELITKWLSKREGSLHKGKRKTQIYGVDDAKRGGKKNNKMKMTNN